VERLCLRRKELYVVFMAAQASSGAARSNIQMLRARIAGADGDLSKNSRGAGFFSHAPKASYTQEVWYTGMATDFCRASFSSSSPCAMTRSDET
jgi:hypothetical protein